MYFSDVFHVSSELLEAENVFDISLVSDLPLFIDPFLIFESNKAEYQRLHKDVVGYVRFLRTKIMENALSPAQEREWLHLPEVPQNWLGYSIGSNAGRGLGSNFARGAILGLKGPVRDFGSEKVSNGSHIERLFLFSEGAGRDALSDFITNLCKEFLLKFTEEFAKKHLDPSTCREMNVRRVRFDYSMERWKPGRFVLPVFNTQYVLLTPIDLLTQSIPWINRPELFEKFGGILDSIGDSELRASVNQFIEQRLAPPPGHPPNKEFRPTRKDTLSAQQSALQRFPEIANWYVAEKESHGEEAVKQSKRRVTRAAELYHTRIVRFVSETLQESGFFDADAGDMKQLLLLFAQSIEKGGRDLFLTEDALLHDITVPDVELICALAWRADGNKTRQLPRFRFISDSASASRFESNTRSLSRVPGTLVVTTDPAKKKRVNFIKETAQIDNLEAASITGIEEGENDVESVFISYTKADEAWARWIGGVLLAAGYAVTVQYKDFLPGTNFVQEMDAAVKETDRTIAVLSRAYLDSKFAAAEWQAAFREDPLGERRKLIPIRVEKVSPSGLLGSIAYADLVGLSERSATAVLLGATGAAKRPKEEASIPAFPGTATQHEDFDVFLASVPEVIRGPVASSDALKRLELASKVASLSTDKVNLLVYALEPPDHEIPPLNAAAKDRATALLDWCSREGIDFVVLEKLVNTLEN